MPFLFGWLLNGVYLLIVLAVAPILVLRRITQGKYRRGWIERLTGRLVRKHPDRMCLWFHAVSVGEVLQLQKILGETEVRFPDAELFLTVTTETGYDLALTKYPRCTVSFFPLDFTWAVNSALAAIHPDLIVLVELELWPNLILTARRRQIPLVLINGRMGDKSFRGYLRLKPLMSRLLGCFDVLAVQTETYADRLKSLGAPPDRVCITGNIKFDRVESDRDNPKTLELRSGFHLNESDCVFIAGSTQDPEETCAIDAWLNLRKEFPQLRLILVPRHKERFDEVATLIRDKGCDLLRRSEVIANSTMVGLPVTESETPVVALLDTLGELAACWGLADIAFVGGSLTNRGGQNMMEPAGFGAAVVFGPNTWNFKDVTEALLSRNAARVIASPDELYGTVRQLLQQPEEARCLGEAARNFVLTQRGATARTVDLISQSVRKRPGDLNPSQEISAISVRPNLVWPLVKWFLCALVFVFIGRRALQVWESAPPGTIHIKWMWLLAASAFYFVGWLPSVWFWRALLHSIQQPLDWWNALRAYYVGHLGKYVPGKALVLVIRGSIVKQAGTDPILAGVTAAYETLVFMATGAALSLAIFPFAFRHSEWIWLPGPFHGLREWPSLLSFVVVVVTFATTPVIAWVFSRMGRRQMDVDSMVSGVSPTISAALISLGIAMTSVGWICHALSLGCVLQAISDAPFSGNSFPRWLAATTVSTVGGFVVLIAPGGLGVREGLLIEALKDQPEISPSTAVIAAGLLRAVWFATELVAAIVFYIAKPKA